MEIVICLPTEASAQGRELGIFQTLYVSCFMFYDVPMWLLNVTPISRGIPKERLYYFSPSRIAEGDLIEVPLRSKTIVAKVESVRAVIDTKAELKSLPFAIRKVETVKIPRFFSAAFMEAANDAALYFCSTLGAALYSLLPPKRLLDSLPDIFNEKKSVSPPNLEQDIFVLQCQDKDRVAAYRLIIREEFAKGKSVILIAPTISETIAIYKNIGKGIENYAYLLHQRLSKFAVAETWKKAADEKHPIVLVTTPLFLGLPRNDLGTIIIERESSRMYKKESRPFADYRIFAQLLAKRLGVRMIRGDSTIESATFNELETGRWYKHDKTSFRFLSSANTKTIIFNSEASRKSQSPISKEIFELIEENRETGGHFFILSPRRGLASRTICRDCGKSLSCPNCGGTLVLHGGRRSAEDIPKYLCHKCGTEIASTVRCERCKSWNLAPFGVGSEKIEREITKKYPDLKIFRLDRDTAARDSLADKIAGQFLSSAGGILVGTELALSRVNQKIETVAILYPELLTTMPEYSADEEALRLMLRAKSLAEKKFVIQTADSELPLLSQIEDSNLSDFYRNELAIRKSLNYPPFRIMILISWKPNNKFKSQIEAMLAPYKPIYFSGWATGVKKEERALIKLKPDDWPNEKLREKLLSLPASCAVEVSPNRIFS